jgi:hypothetical protein
VLGFELRASPLLHNGILLSNKMKRTTWAWYYKPVIPALQGTQEEHNFQASLSCFVSKKASKQKK